MAHSVPDVYNPGDLRWRIVLQQATVSRGTAGSQVRDWTQPAAQITRSASISTTGGREFLQARSVNAKLSHEVVIRWVPGIVPNTWRVRFDDPKDGSTRYFDIHDSVAPDERRRMLHLFCEELIGRDPET